MQSPYPQLLPFLSFQEARLVLHLSRLTRRSFFLSSICVLLAKIVPLDPFLIFILAVLSCTYIFRVNTVRLVSGILSVVGAILLVTGGCCVKKKFNKWANSPGGLFFLLVTQLLNTHHFHFQFRIFLLEVFLSDIRSMENNMYMY